MIQNWGGRILRVGMAHYDYTSILVAKARAIRDGLRTVIQEGFGQLLMEGDNKIIIQALKRKIRVLWQIRNIIKDIHV